MSIFIGIDFSLNSPAYCVLSNSKFFWGSLTRSDRGEDSFLKSANKPYSVLSKTPNFNLTFLTKEKLPEEYSAKERIKIDYFLELVDFFWSGIEPHIECPKTHIAIEGLSFASNGNALIDISMATALLRAKITQKIGSQNFHVFSPTSVKKFAVKGNAKKDELYQALIEQKMKGTNFETLTKTLQMYQSQWITPAKSVNKPVDDLVDATWICLKLLHDLGNPLSSHEN